MAVLNYNDLSKMQYSRQEVPEHTVQSIDNYLVHGYQPGSFVKAMLAGDMFRAIGCADTTNRNAIWAIGYSIMHVLPQSSWGSYEAVDDWCNDVGGRRTKWVTDREKQQAWDILTREQAKANFEDPTPPF